MVEAVVVSLIWILVLFGLGWLVIYVLGAVGIVLPPVIITIGVIILGLIALLILYRMLKQSPIGGYLP